MKPDAPPHLSTPEAIYAESFRRARAETDLSAVAASLRPLTLRLAHAAGDPDIAPLLRASDGAAEAGRRALSDGALILCDAAMVAAGVTRRALPASNDVMCCLDLSGVAGAARRQGITRSAAAVDFWQPWQAGAVVTIGNAPTALFRLLETLAAGGPKPAIILGFPVGFVGAAESKQALVERATALDVPFITLLGRRGGSALAAAAVNTLAMEASGIEIPGVAGTGGAP